MILRLNISNKYIKNNFILNIYKTSEIWSWNKNGPDSLPSKCGLVATFSPGWGIRKQPILWKHEWMCFLNCCSSMCWLSMICTKILYQNDFCDRWKVLLHMMNMVCFCNIQKNTFLFQVRNKTAFPPIIYPSKLSSLYANAWRYISAQRSIFLISATAN